MFQGNDSNTTGRLPRLKAWLSSLSFRTGVIVLACCVPCYVLSFAQMLLPISATAKGVLWATLFGMAKAFQYGGLAILGAEGYKRLRSKLRGSSGSGLKGRNASESVDK